MRAALVPPGAPAGDGARRRDGFAVEADVAARRGDRDARRDLVARRRAAFSRAGKEISASARSRALAPAVFLAPEHRELVTGRPAARRRFLDRLVARLRPAAGDDLARYERGSPRAKRAARPAGKAAARARRRASSRPGPRSSCLAGAAVRRHRRAALADWRARFRARSAARPGRNTPAIRVDVFGRRGVGRGPAGGLASGSCRSSAGGAIRWPDRTATTCSGRAAAEPLAAEASAGRDRPRWSALAKLAEWTRSSRGRGRAAALRRRRLRRGPLGRRGSRLLRGAAAGRRPCS